MPITFNFLPAGSGDAKSDIEVFEEWFKEDLSEVYFYAPGGSSNVETFLQETLNKSSKGEIYGIIDRDFRTNKKLKPLLIVILNNL